MFNGLGFVGVLIAGLMFNIVGCGEGETKEAPSMPVVNSTEEIYGTWKLKEVTFEKNPDLEILMTGSATSTIRANDTYFNEWKSFSLSLGETKFYESCTGFASGKGEIEDGEGISSDIVAVGISGNCSFVESFSAIELADQAAKYYLEGEKMIMASEFSYEENGEAASDALNFIYEKQNEESWDGEGTDPRFVKKWKMQEAYVDIDNCTTESDGNYKISLSGDYIIDVSDNKFTETQSDFKFGEAAACSATSEWTMNADKLNFDFSQRSSTDDCAKVDDSGKSSFFIRDIAVDDSYVRVESAKYEDSSCDDGNRKQITIMLFEEE